MCVSSPNQTAKPTGTRNGIRHDRHSMPVPTAVLHLCHHQVASLEQDRRDTAFL